MHAPQCGFCANGKQLHFLRISTICCRCCDIKHLSVQSQLTKKRIQPRKPAGFTEDLKILMPSYTDTHAHLDLPAFEADIESVLKNATESGVVNIVCVGTSIGSTRRCLELCERFPELLTATAGIHPNHCADAGGSAIEQLKDLAGRTRVVAIGETGLDYHHTYSDHKLQKEFFRRHIELALDLGKPLIIHGRRADEEILNILDDYSPPPAGIRHCFDSSAQIASGYVERGFHVAFGGLITKPGHKKLKKAAALVPDEKLLIETDSPYLTPVGAAPGRNQPAYITHVASTLALLRDVEKEHIAEITTQNAEKLVLAQNV